VRPTLSLVVPFHDVERYIGPCLESLGRQTFTDFEAILVDDGSRDGSLAAAQEFSARDPRFRVVRQVNQGLGPARNTGTKEATGRYLAFVDSDDLVPPRAYDRLVRSLEASGSDLAAGDARRFNDLGVRESYVHREPFAVDRVGTHVREHHALALDRMAWNKVFRRDFWDREGLEFPPMLYEDYPVTIKAHVRARAVDVLATPVYYWREREGGDLSITQRRWQLANLRDRATSALAVLDFLADEAPELLPVVEQHLLHIDVSAIAGAVHENDPDERAEVLAHACALLGRTSRTSRAALVPFERVQNHLLERGLLAELEQLVDHRHRHGIGAPLRRSGRVRPRFHLQLPFLDDREVGLPRSAYRVPTTHVSLDAVVRDAAWDDGRLVLVLAVAMRGLPTTPDSRLEVWLERGEGRRARRVDCVVERYDVPRAGFGLDHSGVRVVVNPAAFGEDGLRPGFWKLVLRLRSKGVTRTGPVRRVDPGRARVAPGLRVSERLWARTDLTKRGFGIQLRATPYTVETGEVVDDAVVLSGRLPGPPPTTPPALRLRVDDGSAEVLCPVELSPAPDGRLAFRAAFRADDLVAHEQQDPVQERTVWLVRMLLDDREQALAVPPDARLAGVTRGARRITTEVSLHGNLLVHEGFAHPRVTAARWQGEDVLVEGTQDRTGERPWGLVARRYVTPADRVEVAVPVTWSGAGFTARVPLDGLVAAASAVTTGDEGHGTTPWELLMPLGDRLDPLHVDTSDTAALAAPRVDGARHARLTLGRSARFRLVVE
jgi:hypothetical protein